MARLREANFTYLLIGLLFTLLAGPISNEFSGQPPGFIIQVTFTVTLIVGIWTLIESRTWFRVGVILAAMELIATVTNYLRPNVMLQHLTLLFALAFCALSLIIALRQVFTGDRMNGNRVIGAICVYLLLGLLLAITNVFVYLLIPGSFNGVVSGGNANQGLDLIYYSYVTMTTLGYGDITPAGPLARALAYLGAIMGQFYIAILVGMVVGLYISENRRAD